ncbi:MAG: lamin tail domain-containing protein, partial [Verrucomicrobiota bacterium]
MTSPCLSCLRPLVFIFLVLLCGSFGLRAEQVQISEIMYHPSEGLPEFVEISNITSTAFDIADWRLRGGVDFDFPSFSSGQASASFLGAFERIVITSASPSQFRAAYSVPGNVRVFGPWMGKLSNGGERLTLRDKNGVVMSTVRYNDRGRWPVAADGTGHSLSLVDPDLVSDNWRNWTVSNEPGGTPGTAEIVEAEEPFRNPEVDLSVGVPFVQYGDSWKYFDQNTNLGNLWRQPAYNDGSWKTGNGLFGFENSSLPAPGIQTGLTNSSDAANHITYYFRKTFTYSGETDGANITIDQIVDDGASYYLNGQAIGGLGVPTGAGWKDTANRVVSNATEELGVVKTGGSALVVGTNVLAAEVHQTNAGSSDCVFGARLSIGVPTQSNVVINEVTLTSGSDGFIEFFNRSGGSINLRNHFLSDDPSQLS